MKTIYFDNMIYSYLYDNPKLRMQFEKIISKQNLKLVVSLYNIADFVTNADSDMAKKRAIETANWLDTFIKPLFIYDSFTLKKWEMERFIRKNCYQDVFEFEATTSYLSLIDKELLGISHANLGIKLTDYVLDFYKNRKHLQNVCDKGAKSLDTLQKAKESKKLAKIINNIDKEYIASYINLIRGIRIPPDKKSNLVDYCVTNNKIFFRQCLCFAVENSLMEHRISNPKRKPEIQDSYDLQHALLALSYCNYFITNEGYILNGADYVKKHVNGVKTNIFRTLEDFWKTLQNSHNDFFENE